MRTSTILASFFTLLTTSLLSQSNLACVNVEQSKSGLTSIRMRGSGETCGQFSTIVSKAGFQFKVFTPHKSTDTILGYVRVYFGNLPLPLSFLNDDTELVVQTSGTYIGNALLDVTTFDIKSDGTGFVVPRKPAAASIKIPSLGEFEQQPEDKVKINLRVEWTDVINEIVIELPNHANNNPSTPPQSTTSAFMSTKLISHTEVNETATTSAILTSTAQTTSTSTSNASWIVVGAVVGCVVVIIVIAAVVEAVFIARRIRRKRSATGLLQTPTTRVTYPSNKIHRFNIPIDPKSKITDHGINFNDYLAVIGAVVGCVFVIVVIAAGIGAVYVIRRVRRKRSATGLLATPTTRVTYPSNEIHRFNIPIDPKSKITDHGINFNDYLAVVPAYPEEIREFESAEKKKKDEMYAGFIERIQIAERTENKGSK